MVIISTNLSFLRNFILFGEIFYTYSVPTERLSRCSLFLQTFSFLRNLFYLGKFYTNISVPTERLSRCSLFLQTFRSYGTLFYWGYFITHIAFLRNAFLGTLFSTNLSFLWNFIYLGKFSTHIAFLRNAFLVVHYFYKSFVPTELYFILENFLHKYRSYGTLHKNLIFYHLASNILLRIFSLPFFLQFFSDFSFCSVFARNIKLGSRNFIGQEFLVYKISFVRMCILIFFAII